MAGDIDELWQDGVPRGDILVVDDDRANLQLLSHILRTHDFDVRVATSGSQALELVEASQPDLILLDIVMPGMDGIEVCRRLHEQESTGDIPVIFLSALGSLDDKVRAFGAGGVDYVTKPFQVDEVLVRVRSHIALRRLRTELRRRNLELEQSNEELQTALDTIQTLSGLIPICGWCGRKIEDERGEWVAVETYIEAHSEASFTHGMCPACLDSATEEAAKVLHKRRLAEGETEQDE